MAGWDPQCSLELELDTLPDAILVANASTQQIVAANAAARALFERDPTDLIGMSQWALHPREDKNAYIEAFKRGVDGERVNRLANGQPVYIETPDGERVPVEINVRRVKTDDTVFVVGSFREATAQIDRERRLQETKTRLAALLKTLPVPVTTVDTDGYITGWNQAAEATFGYTGDRIKGSQFPALIGTEQSDHVFAQIANGCSVDGHETVYRAKDSSYIPVQVYASPRYQDGELVGGAIVLVDVSTQEQQEQQLKVIYRVLRHNLRNEVNVITGWTEQLQDAGTEQQDAAASAIQTAGERIGSLIEEANKLRTNLFETDSQPSMISVTDTISFIADQLGDKAVTIKSTVQSEDAVIRHRGATASSLLINTIASYGQESAIELDVSVDGQYMLLELTTPAASLPPGAHTFIADGGETSLDHGSSIAVQRAYMMVRSIGGTMRVLSALAAESAETIAVEIPIVR